MKTRISTEDWVRKAHFDFFSQFDEPFFGVTISIDCTRAYQAAKARQVSFFLYYLYRALKAANSVENFRYQIVDKEAYVFDQVHASPTISRPDGTFGFGYMCYDADEQAFYKAALRETDRVRQGTGLEPSRPGMNLIHFSAIPWLRFTSISHARSFSYPDSCPKISFGKMTDANGVRTMPVSIHVHHALADGYHVGLFAERFQQLMDKG